MKLPAAMLLSVAACTLPSGPTSRFTGAVTPTTPGPLCPASRASLQIKDGSVVFSPDEGTWILTGTLAPDNTLTADKSRVASNNQVYDTTFEGRLSPGKISGTYKTPRCSYNVVLTSR